MFASNHHQIFRSSSINNENNAILPAKSGDAGAVTKTPAASGKQRRALGDISNRKGPGGLGNKNGNGVVLAKKAQTPGGQLQPKKPFASIQKQAKATSTTPGLSKRSETAILPRQTQVKPASSSFDIRPGRNETIKQGKSTKAKTTVTFEEPVDDIEQPAGRLWVDQPDYDDDDTSVSLPGAATLQENWAAASLARYKRRMQLQDEANQREDEAFDELVAKELQAEEDDILGADVWIERTLSFDLDLDDELSWSAPSYCGEISF